MAVKIQVDKEKVRVKQAVAAQKVAASSRQSELVGKIADRDFKHLDSGDGHRYAVVNKMFNNRVANGRGVADQSLRELWIRERFVNAVSEKRIGISDYSFNAYHVTEEDDTPLYGVDREYALRNYAQDFYYASVGKRFAFTWLQILDKTRCIPPVGDEALLQILSDAYPEVKKAVEENERFLQQQSENVESHPDIKPETKYRFLIRQAAAVVGIPTQYVYSARPVPVETDSDNRDWYAECVFSAIAECQDSRVKPEHKEIARMYAGNPTLAEEKLEAINKERREYGDIFSYIKSRNSYVTLFEIQNLFLNLTPTAIKKELKRLVDGKVVSKDGKGWVIPHLSVKEAQRKAKLKRSEEKLKRIQSKAEELRLKAEKVKSEMSQM
jgi:hypothetical protein